MTLSEFQWRLLYKANLNDSPAIRASNAAMAQILAPKRPRATRRTRKS